MQQEIKNEDRAGNGDGRCGCLILARKRLSTASVSCLVSGVWSLTPTASHTHGHTKDQGSSGH
jgi:hypothetical protein